MKEAVCLASDGAGFRGATAPCGEVARRGCVRRPPAHRALKKWTSREVNVSRAGPGTKGISKPLPFLWRSSKPPKDKNRENRGTASLLESSGWWRPPVKYCQTICKLKKEFTSNRKINRKIQRGLFLESVAFHSSYPEPRTVAVSVDTVFSLLPFRWTQHLARRSRVRERSL